MHTVTAVVTKCRFPGPQDLNPGLFRVAPMLSRAGGPCLKGTRDVSVSSGGKVAPLSQFLLELELSWAAEETTVQATPLGLPGAGDSEINKPRPAGGRGGRGPAPQPGLTRAAQQWNHPRFLVGWALC